MYSTRFQGSKRRVLPWLLDLLEGELKEGDTFLDLFSGSGLVAYGMAERGYRVAGADRLQSSAIALQAFIGNKSTLDREIVKEIKPVSSRDTLFREYQGLFYPDDELRWLLGAAEFGRGLRGGRRAIFFWALFQAALAKRPYNLFHRANLEMRTRSVQRSFGNARTWEKPFPESFANFLDEQRQKALPDAPPAKAFVGDVSRLSLPRSDMIYIDPPYIPERGESIDYTDFYGFLDLLLRPSLRRNRELQHRPLAHRRSAWEKRSMFLETLRKFADKHRNSTVALSYRLDGYPSAEELQEALGGDAKLYRQPIRYALSHRNSAEILLLRAKA